MKSKLAIFWLVAALAGSARAAAPEGGVPEQAPPPTNQVAVLYQPSASPLVTFRILFHTGAAHDPAGQEGVAALTAAMIAEGGSQRLAYAQILERMYPMATAFRWQVDKEMTVFHGTTHVDNLSRYFGLIRDMLLQPGFREDDFQRLKTDAINFLSVVLREGNDEELGKERLYQNIYKGHPYEHHNSGTVSSLRALTLAQVRDFYRSNYTQGNLVLGLAGGFPADFGEFARKEFAGLPPGEKISRDFAFPELETGMRIELVQRDTRSTAISIGFPIQVTRGDEDYPALALASSFFGQHRSSNSYLFQRLRELRGLNYGNYSYIEYFPRGMYQFQPDPNLARQQQIFQIWIRPVPPEQSLFTLRAALYELDKFTEEGLSQAAFESTRDFMIKFVDVLLQTQSSQLGYALDSRYYGIKEYGEYMKAALKSLTRERVNEAIRRHLRSDTLRVVMVTKNADQLKQQILDGKPSPISYNSPKPDWLLQEDKIIEAYPVNVQPELVRITPAAEIFQ